MAKEYNFHLDATACAGCRACQIACKDKHGLEVGRLWRRVYEVTGGGWHPAGPTWTSDVFAFNLSIACNHCRRPICVEVCPAQAITRRNDGIVLLDSERCLGCSYCEWACPYSAPQFDAARGCMTKCSFCADEIDADRPPVCVSACPLRVLEFEVVDSDGTPATRQIDSRNRPHKPLPEASLTEPALIIKPHRDAQRADKEAVEVVPRRRHEMNEWALVFFTLATQMAAGIVLTLSCVRTLLPGAILSTRLSSTSLLVSMMLLLVGLGFSLFHLGTPRRAPSAISNIRSSWLSREISLALLVTGAVAMSYWLATKSPDRQVDQNLLIWSAALLGLVFVFVMSRVYMLRTIPAWNRTSTLLSFFASSWLLGSLVVVVIDWITSEHGATTSLLRPLGCTGLVLLNFAWLVIRGWLAPTPAPGWNNLARWVLVILGVFALGGIVLLSFTDNSSRTLLTGLVWTSLGLVLGSEIMERYRFFKSYARSGV